MPPARPVDPVDDLPPPRSPRPHTLFSPRSGKKSCPGLPTPGHSLPHPTHSDPLFFDRKLRPPSTPSYSPVMTPIHPTHNTEQTTTGCALLLRGSSLTGMSHPLGVVIPPFRPPLNGNRD
eukprot:767988-Hanusia_phi.AAC.4